MTAAVAAAVAVRHRRTIVIGAAAAAITAWTVVMAVVVVALGGTPPPAELATGLGIPPVVADAYQRAAATPDAQACGLRWQILAGIGRVESNHTAGHTVDPDGTVTPPIVGPVLDGNGGTARVADTDLGTLDGDAVYDHAVGPMQFLPTSWAAFAVDGNDDGRADPHNIYDATAGAVRHLCANRTGPLDDDQALHAALLAYNHSDSYAANVTGWIHYYDQAALAGPTAAAAPTGNIVDVRGIQVDASIAASLDALLTAADQHGLSLTGGGYRSHDQQIALRRAHCGTSHYATFDMAADACTPPTARPGESLHESGLAIDFTCNGTLVTRNDPCFAFLAATAPTYGLTNLPSEAWHWSVGGR